MQKQTEGIVSRLIANAAGIRYGSVGVELKIHDGRITGKVYTVTETHLERVTGTEEGKPQTGDATA
jgi:hypothetical protein